jgi:adenosylhomocysteine nucleosidase
MPATVLSGDDRFAADAALAQRFGGLTEHTLLAGTFVVADTAGKAELRGATGAHAVDLESGAVARVATEHGLPFAVIRAVCDPATRNLPPAALLALDSSGAIGFSAVIGSVCRNPAQIPALIALGLDAARARRSLLRLVTLAARSAIASGCTPA